MNPLVPIVLEMLDHLHKLATQVSADTAAGVSELREKAKAAVAGIESQPLSLTVDEVHKIATTVVQTVKDDVADLSTKVDAVVQAAKVPAEAPATGT